jgi:hypothetical protein
MAMSSAKGGPHVRPSESDANDPLARRRAGAVCRQTHATFLAEHRLSAWKLKITHVQTERISVTSTFPNKQRDLTREIAVTPTLADDLRLMLEQDFLEWQDRNASGRPRP